MPDLNKSVSGHKSCSTKEAIYIFNNIDCFIEKLRNPGTSSVESMDLWESIKIPQRFFKPSSWISTLNSKELIIFTAVRSSLKEAKIFNVETQKVKSTGDLSESGVNLETNVVNISKAFIVFGGNQEG